MQGPTTNTFLAVEKLAPVRERVADRLREAIFQQHFAPGAALVERELCEGTGSSRASVREALRLLESEGLVVSAPGKGTRVAELSPAEALHNYEVRCSLESLAGALFARRATAEQLDALDACVARLAETEEDRRDRLRAKEDYYDVLFTGAENPELRQIHRGLLRRASLARVSSLAHPGRPAEATQELREIAAAARDRDEARTAQLCDAHVRAAAAATFGSEAERLGADHRADHRLGR